MKTRPDISIIVPVYNAEMFLSRCMASLLAQSHKNIEIIFVNDGSTDGSLNNLVEFRDKFSNVYIFSQANRGAGTARNIGLNHASGEFVLFLDVDDYLFPDCCQIALESIKYSKANFICFGADFLSTRGNLVVQAPTKDCEIFGLDILRDVLLGGHIKSVVWNKIYRREFLNKNLIRFNDERVNEDSLFVLKAASHACHVKLIACVLYRHNSDNLNSLSNSVDISYFKSTINILESEKRFLLEKKLIDSISLEFEIHVLRLMFFMIFFAALNISNFNEYRRCINLFKLSNFGVFSSGNNLPKNLRLMIYLRALLTKYFNITWVVGRCLKRFKYSIY